MLPRDFTEEQQMFRDAYRKFLAAEIVPHMEEWREAGIVDREAFRKEWDAKCEKKGDLLGSVPDLQAIFSNCLPRFLPSNSRRKVAGVFSKPS